MVNIKSVIQIHQSFILINIYFSLGPNLNSNNNHASIISGANLPGSEFNSQYYSHQSNVSNHQSSPQSNTTNLSSSPIHFPSHFESNQASKLDPNQMQYQNPSWYNNPADTRFSSNFWIHFLIGSYIISKYSSEGIDVCILEAPWAIIFKLKRFFLAFLKWN